MQKTSGLEPDPGSKDERMMTWLHQEPPFHGLAHVEVDGPTHMQVSRENVSETASKQAEKGSMGTSDK